MHLLLIEFVYNNSYHASLEMAIYEALYRRKCRSPLCWEVGEKQLTGLEFVQVTLKSYTDPRRIDVLFSIGDMVFLKISPMKGVMRFGKKGN